MEDPVLLRPIELKDIPSVAALLSEAFYPSHSWLAWATPILKLGIYQDLRSRYLMPPPQYACFVAVKVVRNNPTVVGTVEVAAKSVFAWGASSLPILYISNLAVARSMRRQGVGRQLLLACEQVVRTWGGNELYLHVQGENQAARSLYARTGYQLFRAEVPVLARLLGHPQQLLLRKVLQPQERMFVEHHRG